jgi:hypothetical protein
LRAASAYADLVFHGLAFVPTAVTAPPASRAASLFWPAYVAWVKREMPREAWALLEEDAPVLAKLFEPTRVAHAIGWMAELHGSIDDFLRVASRPLLELGDDDVVSADALKALVALPPEPVEILRADLAIVARAFEPTHERSLCPHAERARSAVVARARGLFEHLRLGDVELSPTLGLRGRGFPTRVVVGTWALPGEPIDPDPTLVYAVHEIAVQRASDVLAAHGRAGAWADVEAVALAVEEGLFHATPLQPAFDRWAEAIDRSGLSDLAQAGLAPYVGEVRLLLDVGKME